MSIGKGSITRAKNAEKNGAANILTTAPDMENSTPVVDAGPVAKKVPTKRKTKTATTVLANPSPETVAAVRGDSCPIGEKMPVYLL